MNGVRKVKVPVKNSFMAKSPLTIFLGDKIIKKTISVYMGSGSDSVGRAVASDNRDLPFKSSHRPIY